MNNLSNINSMFFNGIFSCCILAAGYKTLSGFAGRELIPSFGQNNQGAAGNALQRQRFSPSEIRLRCFTQAINYMALGMLSKIPTQNYSTFYGLSNLIGLSIFLIGNYVHYKSFSHQQRDQGLAMLNRETAAATMLVALYWLVTVNMEAKLGGLMQNAFNQGCGLDALRDGIQSGVQVALNSRIHEGKKNHIEFLLPGIGNRSIFSKIFEAVNKTYSITCKNFLPLNDVVTIGVHPEDMQNPVMWGLDLLYGPFLAIRTLCNGLFQRITVIAQDNLNGDVLKTVDVVHSISNSLSSCSFLKEDGEIYKRILKLIQTGTILSPQGANITLV